MLQARRVYTTLELPPATADGTASMETAVICINSIPLLAVVEEHPLGEVVSARLPQCSTLSGGSM